MTLRRAYKFDGYVDHEFVIAPPVAQSLELAQLTGRPVDLTDELEGAILERIRAGAWPHHAAGAEGIAKETWQRWMRDTRDRFALLRLRVYRARSEAVAEVSARLKLANPRTWAMRGPSRQERDDVPSWTEATLKIEQAVRHEHTLPIADLGRLSLEELEQYERLTRKALPPAEVEAKIVEVEEVDPAEAEATAYAEEGTLQDPLTENADLDVTH